MTNRISRLKTALFANPREISLERAQQRISLNMLKFRFVMKN